ncbi:hypothetical protein MITS9508_00972 [Synechococcus sp. MIT S9508]|nr:hypothetical protein MITS9508_00972 [Synechococcus sp. MIT S9508]
MKRLIVLVLLAPSPVIASPKCQWVSEPNPDAVIQIGEVSPIGILSAELVWKGKVIRSLLMGQPNGYGSRWWAHKGNDGKPIGGGRLVPFRGNQPTRGTNREELGETAPRKALIVGLGSDIYYSDMRGERGLITAAEGFWHIPTNCETPGRGNW